MADDNKKASEETIAFIHYDKVKLYPEGSIKLTGAATMDYIERAGKISSFFKDLLFSF
jgi:hypothetical protein